VSNWPVKPITEIVDFNPLRKIKKGSTAPFIEMAALPINARKITGVGEREFKGLGSKFQNGDTLFARITPCLENGKSVKVTVLDNDDVAHGSTEFIVMSAKNKEYDEDFVYYISRLPEFRNYAQSRMEGTSGRQRVSWQALAAYELPIPPREVRKQIGEILCSIDDKIELNRQVNQTLEQIAQAIFKSWFVDFGPTRAKMEGCTPYLAPEIWNLFPDTLDDDGKPAGWEIRPASDLFQLNPRESIRKGTRTPYLDMAALPTVGAVPDAPIQREYKSGSKFRDGDTLFARITPCLENGKTAYVFDLGNEVVGTGSTEFIVIRSHLPRPKAASYLLARDPEFRACAERSMTGTSGRQRADLEVLGQYKVAVPNDDRIWTALGNLIDPMMDGIIANAHESRTIAQIRDLLLPKLISGKIHLRDAEKVVEVMA